jgi:hypothetical protein
LPLLAEGEFALAHEHLRQAIGKVGSPTKRGSSGNEHDLYVLMVESAVIQRDAEVLRRCILAAEDSSRQAGHRLYMAIARRGRGVLLRLEGDVERARRELESALRAFEAEETPWQIGRTELELAELEIGAGRWEAGAAHLARARDEFSRLRATAWIAKCDELRVPPH